MAPNVNQPAATRAKDPFSLLIECAVQSFVEALMTLIWGNIIFGLVGGIIGSMVPSLPPGISGETAPPHHARISANWFGDHQLWIIFAVFFILNLRALIAGPLLGDTDKETRFLRIARRLRKEGLSLLFKNAIGALIAAWVASLVGGFSWTQMCLHWLFGAIAPTFSQWAGQTFGEAQVGAAQSWWNWWGDNQLKFSFWLFYLTAICDDLGIPNLKTLARFVWLRFRQRFSAPVNSSGQQPV